MSRGRYERVPQADATIDLIPISTTPHYNFNSGVPTSPPPSFHSASSMDLSHETLEHNYNRLENRTPVPSTPHFPRPPPSEAGISVVGGDLRNWTGSVAETSASEALVINLHRRIERLEESVGKLLLEKEALLSPHPDRGNCCVTIPADSDDWKRSSNCCVTVGPSSKRTKQEKDILKVMVILAVFLISVTFGGLAIAWAKVHNCSNCAWEKGMPGY